MIRLRDVGVVFGRTLALSGLDLELHPGITGLFGPNGSGKSTLLRLLTGLLRPTSGSVTFDGAPLSASDESFRGRVGFAGHEPGLYRHLSVRENLDLFGGLHGVRPGRVDEVLEGLELSHLSDTKVGGLSAGVTRRASVARALLHEPDLLLLDEPYANLDDHAAEVVSRALKAWRDGTRVGVVATHGAKRVKPFADAGIILGAGKVVSHRGRSPGAGPGAGPVDEE